MRFSNLHRLLEVLDRRKPKLIVELGSGISTIVVASWLREAGGGHIISLDHDESWAEKTKFYLRQAGLADVAEVWILPLVPTESMGHVVNWYDINKCEWPVNDIDLLIIDGPPAGAADKSKSMSRLPAIQMLNERLSNDCCIVLDDALRNGESRILKTWVSQVPNFKLDVVPTTTGFAILERAIKDELTSDSLHRLAAAN